MTTAISAAAARSGSASTATSAAAAPARRSQAIRRTPTDARRADEIDCHRGGPERDAHRIVEEAVDERDRGREEEPGRQLPDRGLVVGIVPQSVDVDDDVQDTHDEERCVARRP